MRQIACNFWSSAFMIVVYGDVPGKGNRCIDTPCYYEADIILGISEGLEGTLKSGLGHMRGCNGLAIYFMWHMLQN